VLADFVYDYEPGKITDHETKHNYPHWKLELFDELNEYAKSMWKRSDDNHKTARKKQIECVRIAFEKRARQEDAAILKSAARNGGSSALAKSQQQRAAALLSMWTPEFHTGHIMSGDKVVASKAHKHQITFPFDQIRGLSFKAVEMEAAGAFDAVERLNSPHTRRGMVRGIVDDATASKNDDWHPIVCGLVAHFTLGFLEWALANDRVR